MRTIVQIFDYTQVQLTLRRRKLGDVGCPIKIRFRDRKFALHQIAYVLIDSPRSRLAASVSWEYPLTPQSASTDALGACRRMLQIAVANRRAFANNARFRPTPDADSEKAPLSVDPNMRVSIPDLGSTQR